ncbi:MAG: hypothetical protein ACTTHG_01580 [Treponemataceae bacterium]
MIKARDIDKIYYLYKKNFITKEMCTSEFVLCILKHKYYFGLEKLTDETIYDFLFYIFPKFNSIYCNFDDKKSSFCTYFQNKIRLEYLTWKRALLKTNLRNDAILNYSNLEYEIENSQENNVYLNIEVAAENLITSYKSESINATEKQISQFDILVIMLKSVYYLSPAHISTYIEKFNLDFSKIGGLIILAEEQIEEKIKKFNKLKELTNKDFLKKEETKLGLYKLEKESPLYMEYLNEYKKILKRWKIRKKKLSEMKIVPSDQAIADILGISPSKVRYILKKYYRIFKIKENV